MKIFVTSKPKSKKEFVKKTSDFHYSVAVKEEAKEGRANKAIIESLSDYFKLPKSHIVIISGLTSKQKIIEIPLTEYELKRLEDSRQLQPPLF